MTQTTNIETIKSGIVIKRNGTKYLTSSYYADKGYVSAVCIENTDQCGQTYQLPIDECEIHDEAVELVNLSDLKWIIADVDSELIGLADELELPLLKLDLELLQGDSFCLPTKLQEMMNNPVEEVEKQGDNGVTFFGEQEELFIKAIGKMFPDFDKISITDACETGASIFISSTKHKIEGYIGVNFKG